MTLATLLGAGGHFSSSQTWSASTNYYSNVGQGRCAMLANGFMTEASVSQVLRVAGMISRLSWGLDASFPGTLTMALNKGAHATMLAVSIPQGHTGIVTDTTHSISASSGETLDFAVYVGADYTPTPFSKNFYGTTAQFVGVSDSAQLLVAVGPATIGTSSPQWFFNLLGILGPESSDERYEKFYCLSPATWQNVACHVSANSFSANATLTSRINGANGSMAAIIPIGQSGYWEDTSHSDSLTFGALIDYAISTTGISGNLSIDWIGAHVLPTNPSTASRCIIGGSQGGVYRLFDKGPMYSSLSGGGSVGATTARSTSVVPCASTATKFTTFVPDSDNVSATFTVLRNGTATLLAATSSGMTGYFTDNVDVVSLSAGDTITNQITVSSPTIAWASGTLLLEST